MAEKEQDAINNTLPQVKEIEVERYCTPCPKCGDFEEREISHKGKKVRCSYCGIDYEVI